MKKHFLNILAAALVLTGCNEGPTKEEQEAYKEPAEKTIVQKIAAANGLKNFKKAERLKYTFNVRVNDSLRTSRAWEWNTRTGEVTLRTDDTTITYNHRQEADQHEQTDHRFINDQYWLLFPFHLVWDDMTYTYRMNEPAPISGDSLHLVTVTYPEGAGYTPGDVYEIYFGEDHMIREWVYRSGGREENPMATTWEDYEEHGGIKFATMHRNEEGTFELFFDGIEVVTE